MIVATNCGINYLCSIGTCHPHRRLQLTTPKAHCADAQRHQDHNVIAVVLQRFHDAVALTARGIFHLW